MAGKAEKAGREERIDLLRGLSLLAIYVGHCDFSFSFAFQQSRGFADASELFVMMAGMSAALAYGLREPGRGIPVRRIFGRAARLYGVHLLLVLALAAVALLPSPTSPARFLIEDPGTVTTWQIAPLRAAPLAFLADAAMLRALPADLDILPLYVVLMAALPLVLAGARRRVGPVLAASALLWLVAGATHLDFENRLQPGGHWYFDPLSWQFVFVLGLAFGLRIGRGLDPFPDRARLFALAAGFALLSIPGNLALHFTEAGLALQEHHHALAAIFVSKTFCGVLRLLNALALVYVLWNLALLRRACRWSWLAPVRAAGRHSLPVFALGLVLSTAVQGMTGASGSSLPLGLELVLLVAGAALQLGLAVRRDLQRRRMAERRAARLLVGAAPVTL